MPSSQARVGSEKKAHGALAVVSQSERPNEETSTAAARMPTRRATPGAPRVTIRRSAGQKR